MQLVCAGIRSQSQGTSATSCLLFPLPWLPLQYTHLLTGVWLSSRLLSFLTINEPCLTSCGFLGAATISCSSLCAPWLPAQALNTVGAQTMFGGINLFTPAQAPCFAACTVWGSFATYKRNGGNIYYMAPPRAVRAVSYSRTGACPETHS